MSSRQDSSPNKHVHGNAHPGMGINTQDGPYSLGRGEESPVQFHNLGEIYLTPSRVL